MMSYPRIYIDVGQCAGAGRVQHASVVRADENEHQSRWAHVTATRACIVGCVCWSRPAALDRACPRDHGCARRQAHRSRGDDGLSTCRASEHSRRCGDNQPFVRPVVGAMNERKRTPWTNQVILDHVLVYAHIKDIRRIAGLGFQHAHSIVLDKLAYWTLLVVAIAEDARRPDKPR